MSYVPESSVREMKPVFILSHFSCVWLYNTMACSHTGHMSMEFSRQEYWSRLPFHTPGEEMATHSSIVEIKMKWQWLTSNILTLSQVFYKSEVVSVMWWGLARSQRGCHSGRDFSVFRGVVRVLIKDLGCLCLFYLIICFYLRFFFHVRII